MSAMTHAEPSTPWPELLAELRGDTSPGLWRAAARRLREDPAARDTHAKRTVRLSLLATHTTDFLAELLPVAALSCGIDLTLHQVPYGQVEAELLDPAGSLRAARPDYVLLCGTEHDLGLGTAPPDDVVGAAVDRWSGLWKRVRDNVGARVVQCLFAAPDVDARASSAGYDDDTDTAVVARLNAELVRVSGESVLFVDCDRLAAQAGRDVWHDPRHWHTLRQPVSPSALPLLARAVAGVLCADLGLTRRCLVLDLDNTLWGGVLGEAGVLGVAAGQGADGEAFALFQEYLGRLRHRGIALAIASKNDADLVEQALEQAPGMRLRRDDFAAVVADWRPKSEQVREIAARLGLGLDSLAFVDDNPAERAQVRDRLPEVDVISLPGDAALYRRALAGRPTLEPGRVTSDDRNRSTSYAALGEADRLRGASDSLDDFLTSLRMRAQVREMTLSDLDRATQLLQKTNQFNLTTRRYSQQEIATRIGHPDWTCLLLALRDRFAHHGTVGLLLLHRSGTDADIDSLLLSCRVIGRTAERRLLAAAADAARAAGCTRLVGRYVPTARNALVQTLYLDLGFERLPDTAAGPETAARYAYALDGDMFPDTPHISEESD